MATTQRLGIDIVGSDKTRAAFTSAQRSLGAFTRTISFATGALAGIAGGALLKNVIQSFIAINRHVEPVKTSFQQIDRAWQQFALNVGKGGLNEALINFNERIAMMIIRLKGLSDIIGEFLGGAIDTLAFTFEAAGRMAAFLNDNLAGLGSSLSTALGNVLNPLGSLKQMFGEVGGKYGPDFVKSLQAMGLKTDALTMSLEPNKKLLDALPKTFDEIKKAGKGVEDPFETLIKIRQRMFEETRTPLEKYTSGLRELTVVQASLGMSTDLFAREQAKLKEEFLGTGKIVTDNFNAMEEAGKAFSSGFSSALKDLAGGTFSLKSALSDLLSSLTDIFTNRATSLLSGGAGGGFLGKLFGGASFGGFYAGGGTLGAGKWGIAGENGPEMVRGPASIIPPRGNGGGNVTIIDRRTNAPRIDTRQDSKGNITAIVTDAVNNIISSGRADSANRNRYGMTPMKARR